MLQNLKDGISAQGYDIVSFFNGSREKGNVAYISSSNDAKYLFT